MQKIPSWSDSDLTSSLKIGAKSYQGHLPLEKSDVIPRCEFWCYAQIGYSDYDQYLKELKKMNRTYGVDCPFLTLHDLTKAIMKRLPEFKNKKGELSHSTEDGSDWSLGEWCNGACGELGEAANFIKKVRRGDLTIEEAKEDIGKEIADTINYLCVLAVRIGIDLDQTIIRKFNEVSDRIGSDIKL